MAKKFVRNYLNFEKEVYDNTKGAFSIPNFEEEKEKLEKLVEEKMNKIDSEENLDLKKVEIENYRSFSTRVGKEISAVKKGIRAEHFGEVEKGLDELSKYLKEVESTELLERMDQVDRELIERGDGAVFYKKPSFVIETNPINDPEMIQTLMKIMDELNVTYKLKCEGKVVKGDIKNVFGEKKEKEEQKDSESRDMDDGMTA